MIEPKQFREQFPQMKDGYHYLDSAASSLTPFMVLDEVDNYYRNARANIHRGLYKESIWATELYEDARNKVAHFIGADPREIIFTSGSTASANMLMRMIENSPFFEGKSNVVTTVMEHHGTLVPIQQLSTRTGSELRYLGLSGAELAESEVEQKLDDRSAFISVMHASNVLGTINKVRSIADKAHAKGALVLCDITASVGHISVDVWELGADAVWFSGHKMFGPTGVGVLWVKHDVLEKLPPVQFGGDMVERVTMDDATWVTIPERFEAGTPPIAQAVGLGAAIEFIEQIGIEQIRAHNCALFDFAVSKLQILSGVKIISPVDVNNNIGTIAFTVEGIHAHDIAQVLGDSGVAIRAGHHCAMPLHKAMDIPATGRVSLHVYNNEDDVEQLCLGIKKAQQIFL